MTSGNSLRRRGVLKTLGGIGAGIAAGGAGLLVASTGGARAVGSQDLGSASVTSDDGTVQYVAIYGDSVVEWDGFDAEATQFSIDIDARVDGVTSFKNLHSTGKVDLSNSSWGNHDESLSGPGTSGTIKTGIGLGTGGKHNPETDWHIVGTDPDGYGLPTNSISASALENTDGGTTKTFTITIRSTYRWYDSSGGQIFQKTFTSTVDVDVTNEPATATGSSGDGEDGATAA